MACANGDEVTLTAKARDDGKDVGFGMRPQIGHTVTMQYGEVA